MPHIYRRQLLSLLATGSAAAALPFKSHAEPAPAMIAPGPFKPSWKSLGAGYRAPEWFRDAKFGIWVHWGPQAMPGVGDWYARQMYEEGSSAYKHHLANYGHPADTGYMDVLPKWRAEKVDTDALARLYKASGARFLCALAVHHDNFDLYNSRYQAWNSVRIGPKKDLLGMWAASCRKAGLVFGTSSHNAPTWHWFQAAYGYDVVGPRAGERYDAFNRFKEDGKGKWWDGLDPQALYAASAMAPPDRMTWPGDMALYNKITWDRYLPNPPHPGLPQPPIAFVRNWYLRTKQIIDDYDPEFIYFDNAALPLGQAGLDLAAHYYNNSIQRHGSLRAVVTGNFLTEEQCRGIMYNSERGLRPEIMPEPWNAASCIGNWFYNADLFERKAYKTSKTVLNNLCDIVSKNGTYLLSVPLRGDGTLDSEEMRILGEIGEWMSRYGGAIYDTRPWTQAGEGPTQVPTGYNSEAKFGGFTGRDVRFTRKGDDVFALTMGAVPDGQLSLTSFANSARAGVRAVTVAGSDRALSYRRTAEALVVDIPPDLNREPGMAIRIAG